MSGLISSSFATWTLAAESSELKSMGLPALSPKPSIREFAFQDCHLLRFVIPRGAAERC